MNQENLPEEMPPWRAENPTAKQNGRRLLSVAPARLFQSN